MTVATSDRRRPSWVTIIYMASIHLAALPALLPGNFSWSAVGVTAFLHWLTGCLGVTLGFHRLVSHRSFQAPKWLEYFLIFCGSLSAQGGPIRWIGLHRLHHKHSDTSRDPHDSNRGFWFSHMAWMLFEIPIEVEVPRCTKDISGDRFYQCCQKYFVLLQVALGLLLFAIGGWSWVVWGVFVRLVLVFHCTWLVNSATHQFGYQSHDSNDDSRNCWWVALLTYGEGWHNNHHAFQYSARHGLRWWELDVTWGIILLLQWLGLAKNVKIARP
ncbi:MAG: fatty acid desaturase [Cyanobacteria bacterium J06641_5]